MATLWSVRFRDSDEPVEVFASGVFGAAVNARNRTGWFDHPIENIVLLREVDIYTGETVVDYSEPATGTGDNENKEKKE